MTARSVTIVIVSIWLVGPAVAEYGSAESGSFPVDLLRVQRGYAEADLNILPRLSPADFTADGIVNAADFAVFASCFAGASVPHIGSSDCQRADFDQDGDVDQADFGVFQRCLSGSNRPADPDCIN